MELKLKSGWLKDQIEYTLEDMKTWPKWMLLEVELRKIYNERTFHEKDSRSVDE